MNIFALSECPEQSALWLDDIRKNKMILESAQMLSTAIRRLDPDTTLPVYKLAYINHPCSKWARATRGNFMWLIKHMSACPLYPSEAAYDPLCVDLGVPRKIKQK